ncbi:hybrid sensor histidine kinase/response regulator [Streptomyces sp. KMM 9044]|uniref:hybrid sensor histidine kinase/response regulator n=1 Tax=Streptomyces sp. KMM 9044 TaxID=2744474 RepID=UPI0021514B70|nr:PAS domain-containing protein [Streptomyces sp. KMM 9044]WAX79021.1 PAS domain-containing protein [Streptomyces sp. KMM 9044]
MSSRPSRGTARLAAILDALPDALVLVNANGTVVNANTIALEAFETPGTALVGRGLLDLLPEFDSKLIPGSMRRPDHIDPRARTKPTRMVARRTDGTEFPVEVTSANLETGQQAYDNYGYAGDELLMLVVRDLSGTVDTEAELARSQRQTEMILRAAAEGVVGTDTDGRIVLVNPAAAQMLGYRASDLGGRELHTLILHSRADGSPFPYGESPLADTLRSGRKHRVRGQVLYSKSGDRVSVDLTTAPVRDGDQLVGAVMTFTDRRPYDTLVKEKEETERQHAEELERLDEEHASELTALRQNHVRELEELQEAHTEELAANEERYAALGEREKDRFEALTGRHEQLLTLLGQSLRSPLEELRRDLTALAADDAGQLWPEANQVLHHLSAGYSRITTLIDNVLGFQRLDSGTEKITRTKVMLDAVVAAGVDGAVELIGPGRVQFAVHAPPIEAEVDAHLLATALAHLVADVAGVDATGNTPVSAGGYLDNTVVVAAAQRGEVVRIEVRGPYSGGDPVHEPIVRGIVRAHGGVLQTHEVPGMSGSAFVLEVPIGAGAGVVAAGQAPAQLALPAGAPAAEGQGVAPVPGAAPGAAPAEEAAAGGQRGSGGGRRRARRSSVDAFLDSKVPGADDDSGAGTDATAPTGRRRRRASAEPVQPVQVPAQASGGTGRRRGRPAEGSEAAAAAVGPGAGGVVGPAGAIGSGSGVSEGAVVTAAEYAAGSAASNTGLGGTVPPQGVPVPAGGQRARQASGEQHALPPALPAVGGGDGTAGVSQGQGPDQGEGQQAQAAGRRRRVLAAATERAAAQEAAPRTVFALPPAEPDQGEQAGAVDVVGQSPAQGPAQGPVPVTAPGPAASGAAPIDGGRHDAAPHDQSDDHTPPQPHPTSAPTGRRRRAAAQPAEQGTAPSPAQAAQAPASGVPVQAPGGPAGGPAQPVPVPVAPVQGAAPQGAALPSGAPPQDITVQGHMAAVPGQLPQAQAPGQASHDQLQAASAGQPLPQPTALPPAAREQPSAQGQAQPVAPAAEQPASVAQPLPAEAAPGQGTPPQGDPSARPPWPAPGDTSGAGTPVPPNGMPAPTPAPAAPLPPESATPAQRTAQPLPVETAAPSVPVDPNSTQGRAFSVRTLGQGVPFTRQAAQVQQPLPSATPPPHQPGGSGRRRKLGTRPEPAAGQEQSAHPYPATGSAPTQRQAQAVPQTPARAQAPAQTPPPQPPSQTQPQHSIAGQPGQPGQSRLAPTTEGTGRSYAIGAPDADAAEGPEPLDGPGGAVEVADLPRPQPMDDELPPEPLDNPRRLLVWPAPDVATQQALSDRGYRPVIVHSREEVDAQIAAFPAALFVDPLTGPITRTALQSLRTAAVAADVPVLVTAGLGQASRDAAYGADPAVLLKALAPRDSEQHPPRVLLIEEHAEIALALTGTLERRGMQVARAAGDADAVALAGQFRPNLVVMDLMQVRRQQAGIVDWLRANGQLTRTPLVVYTATVDQGDLPRLASGETVLFLAERSTSDEVQDRIVDLLARIGTN